MSMSRYRSKMNYSDAQSEGYSVRTIELSSAFVPSLAPPYPNIEDELRKDVAILQSSLAVRDEYIDRLRNRRDALMRELHMNELIIECQEARIRDYQQFFSSEEHRQKQEPDKNQSSKKHQEKASD